MNRREFIITGLTTAGLVLAAPRVALAGEEKPKYTHVADMYPWDGVYRTLQEIKAAPFSQPPVAPLRIVKNQINRQSLEKICGLFKDSLKMTEVFGSLIDSNIKNDELSTLLLHPKRNFIAFRILTPDTDFAPVASTSENDKQIYGSIQMYLTLENLSEESINKIAQYLNIKL